jgi:hypothetical protein
VDAEVWEELYMNLDKRVFEALMGMDECDLGSVMYHYIHGTDTDDIHNGTIRCIVMMMRHIVYISDVLTMLDERTTAKINCPEEKFCFL